MKQHGLLVVEVYRNKKIYGWSFLDCQSKEIRYQIGAPTKQHKLFAVVSVLHETPFEFVEIGFNKTEKGAFSRVRQRFIADTILKAQAEMRRS
jgi:hypothetical protein